MRFQLPSLNPKLAAMIAAVVSRLGPTKAKWVFVWTPILGGVGILSNVVGLYGPSLGLVCQIPGIYSVCANNGWAGLASPAEQLAWNKLQHQEPSCSSLVSYRQEFREGVYTKRVVEAYDMREKKEVATLADTAKPMSSTVYASNIGNAAPSGSTEADARAVILAQWNARAKEHCINDADFVDGRLVSAEFRPENYTCGYKGNGYSCSLNGKVICSVRAGVIKMVDVCRKP